MTPAVTIAVLAKAPVPGRVKTRLSPPCTPVQAARLAHAALEDTLAAVAGVPAARRVLVLDGDPAGWARRGFDIVPQAPGGLDARLAAAFEVLGGPTLLVGMDTPQITPALLRSAAGTLVEPGVDAVLGLADDGGFWAVGLHAAAPDPFTGVPMSTAGTGGAQLARLRATGRTVRPLPPQRDVDRWADAVAVARTAPGTRFTRAVGTVAARLGPIGAR